MFKTDELKYNIKIDFNGSNRRNSFKYSSRVNEYLLPVVEVNSNVR